jgi:hypothetical protein
LSRVNNTYMQGRAGDDRASACLCDSYFISSDISETEFFTKNDLVEEGPQFKGLPKIVPIFFWHIFSHRI